MKAILIIVVLFIVCALILIKMRSKGQEKINDYSNNQSKDQTRSFSGALNDVRNGTSEFAPEAIRGIEKIKTVLMTDEEIIHSGYGKDGFKNVVYAVTNKRFIACYVGVTSEQLTSINYNKITNVDIKNKLNLSYVVIQTSEKAVEILVQNKPRSVEFFNSINSYT
ncbi:PH domain-containing protein [Paenibacillus sp. HJL G12]|uniref:PH domain-containing protein n=1 Tax=Paenibacillus dendrobii TaxID=2691084 RepID=A0A7X3IJM4_9BACL|nr:PH domain-containing protein [Paenibacillus dendrobii]MWV44920.1 PH domain-containing protein [Paenibacillus dendrobii]